MFYSVCLERASLLQKGKLNRVTRSISKTPLFNNSVTIKEFLEDVVMPFFQFQLVGSQSATVSRSHGLTVSRSHGLVSYPRRVLLIDQWLPKSAAVTETYDTVNNSSMVEISIHKDTML